MLEGTLTIRMSSATRHKIDTVVNGAAVWRSNITNVAGSLEITICRFKRDDIIQALAEGMFSYLLRIYSLKSTVTVTGTNILKLNLSYQWMFQWEPLHKTLLYQFSKSLMCVMFRLNYQNNLGGHKQACFMLPVFPPFHVSSSSSSSSCSPSSASPYT